MKIVSPVAPDAVVRVVIHERGESGHVAVLEDHIGAVSRGFPQGEPVTIEVARAEGPSKKQNLLNALRGAIQHYLKVDHGGLFVIETVKDVGADPENGATRTAVVREILYLGQEIVEAGIRYTVAEVLDKEGKPTGHLYKKSVSRFGQVGGDQVPTMTVQEHQAMYARHAGEGLELAEAHVAKVFESVVSPQKPAEPAPLTPMQEKIRSLEHQLEAARRELASVEKARTKKCVDDLMQEIEPELKRLETYEKLAMETAAQDDEDEELE